jgi:uncharacterized protein YkwD
MRGLALGAVALVALVALAGCDARTAGFARWTQDQRASHGASELAWDPTLAWCSQVWANHLAETGGTLVHGNIGGCMPPGATAQGENLAEGPNDWSTLLAIQNSPAHLANMTDRTWKRFGIGVARTPSGMVIGVWRFSN